VVVSLQNFFGFLASYDGIIALVSRCERLKGKKWLCGYLVRQPSARTSSVQSGIESGVEGQSITKLPLTEHGSSRYCSTGGMIRYGFFFVKMLLQKQYWSSLKKRCSIPLVVLVSIIRFKAYSLSFLNTNNWCVGRY